MPAIIISAIQRFIAIIIMKIMKIMIIIIIT